MKALKEKSFPALSIKI